MEGPGSLKPPSRGWAAPAPGKRSPLEPLRQARGSAALIAVAKMFCKEVSRSLRVRGPMLGLSPVRLAQRAGGQVTPASASHHTGNEFATLSTKLRPCPPAASYGNHHAGRKPGREPAPRSDSQVPASPAPPGSAKTKGDTDSAQSPKAAPAGCPPSTPSPRTR